MNPRSLWSSINDDADGELCYWVNELVRALGAGLAFALAAGMVILLLPAGEGNIGASFLREMWAFVVECAFWLGMLLGMVWSAAKRLWAAFSGVLPWQKAVGKPATGPGSR